MRFKKTDFKGLILIFHNVYSDYRGDFKEILKKNKLEDFLGYNLNFCQANSVKSNLNVLRGLHFQKEPFAQSKLISVAHGEILDIAVDIRKNSKTYGKYFSRILSARNNESIFIPRGFAHGYLTLTKNAIINYEVDNYYKPEMEDGISYKDDFLNIDWGINESKIIISEKDNNLKYFEW